MTDLLFFTSMMLYVYFLRFANTFLPFCTLSPGVKTSIKCQVAVQYHVSDINLISRFAHICRSVKASATPALTVFSGDAFSPSLESAVLKGDHMVPVLNHLGIDVACYGNHGMEIKRSIRS